MPVIRKHNKFIVCLFIGQFFSFNNYFSAYKINILEALVAEVENLQY